MKEINENSNKIHILNFGTFHMGFTTDASTTEFDEHDKENQKRVHDIAEKLSSFRPTVILVERVPEYNEQLQKEYKKYIENPNMFFKNPSEIELLAYELGRLSGTKRIYGIDHKMGYNYMIGDEIENLIDSIWHDEYYEDPLKYYPEVNINEDSLNLLEKLKLNNHDRYLDFLITINADMLTHAGTEKGFEGADEAARYYQRNLRMYSNLNRVNLNENDRVFILMGASHTAFFRDFISRSPKYEMENTFDYLK
ncbi:hypothetical protein E1171_04885 [Cytophagales bacterium RKSG123]|nr:hypothetical protein [Xanthovirga aplysinae]